MGGGVMNRNNSGPFVTKLLMIGALAEFVVVEVLLVVIFRKNPNPYLRLGLVSVYTTCLMVSIPAAAGMRGYFIVRKLQLPASDGEMMALRLSRLFLSGVVGAYTALILIVEILS
jgi:hypothetical protein